ncbi:MAG: efflux transporter outer membrane subunit [marine benthic group bacterium]|nr:efflux transporter outer membrane subunit [Gemmatimonadota bacterium]
MNVSALRPARASILTASLLLTLATGGCKLGPDYVPPPVPVHETYREPVPPGESLANLPWWELFGDPVLRDLVQEALEQNRDLQVALARIAEARAQAGFTKADLYPRVNIGAGADLSESWTSDGSSVPTRNVFLAADVFFEVDLWGKLRRSNEAAFQELLATEEAYRSVTITLVADVASLYLQLRDLDNRLRISERTLDARQEALEIIRVRFEAGVVPEVDLNQAEIQAYEAEASVESFRRLRTQTENAISVLLGRAPESIERGLALAEQELPPEIPVGLPSELLQRRPDVLQAERQLAAQTARIGVAEALKFPSLTLTGTGGVSDDLTDGGLTTGILGLGAQLFGPLFNAGKNQRRVEIEQARTEQLLYTYEQSILTAFREVEDAIVATNTYRDEYEARQRQVESATSAAELSWVRYEGGLTSYLEVLDLQRSQFSAELAASQTLQLHLSSIVQLYKALGGGWTVPEQLASAGTGNDAD